MQYILYLLIIADQVCRRNQTSVDNVWEAALRATLRSDNSEVHENLAKKIDSALFQTILRLSQVAQILKRLEFMLELKRGGLS